MEGKYLALLVGFIALYLVVSRAVRLIGRGQNVGRKYED